MSTSWSRQIGSLVGGSLAEPGGAIIGGIAASILGRAIEIDDPLRDATDIPRLVRSLVAG